MTEEEKQEAATAGDAPAGEEKQPEQMTEEELRAEIEKHFREQKVDDVLVQFLVTLTNLAYIKMGLTEDTQDVKDLGQAGLAIDAFKALLDAAEKRLPEQDAKALAGALSSMQLTFVKASGESAAPGKSATPCKSATPGDSSEPGTGSGGGVDSKKDDPASRLWVPGKE